MTEPMTAFERVAAAKAGDKRWCTACGEDRVDQRSQLCPTCRKETRRLRRREAQRRRKAADPAAFKAHANEVARKYREAHIDKARARARKTSAAKRAREPEVLQEACRRWRRAHPDRASQDSANRRARLTEQQATEERDRYAANRRKRYREDSQYREGIQARNRAGIERKRQDAKVGTPLPATAAVDWGADIELED